MKNSNAVHVDNDPIRFEKDAFNRGLDDVLTLRPLRKSIAGMVLGSVRVGSTIVAHSPEKPPKK